MKTTKLGLFGAKGRMGLRVTALLQERPQFKLVEAVDVNTAPEVRFTDCDVVLDVSLPAATDGLLARLEGSRAALVTGVTGRDEAQEAAIRARAEIAPVFIASNFSVGVAVLTRLARQAAAALGPEFDAEIFEIHHKAKVDAPSGTALTLGRAVAEGQGQAWPAARVPAREGHTGARQPGEIGVSAARGGRVVGEHTVYFFGEAERLELTHRAQDRVVLAEGALRASGWLHGRAPGIYGMDDLLGFK